MNQILACEARKMPENCSIVPATDLFSFSKKDLDVSINYVSVDVA